MFYYIEFSIPYPTQQTLNYPYYTWPYDTSSIKQISLKTSSDKPIINPINKEQKLSPLNQEKMNRRNILPNIMRKIISFIRAKHITQNLILKIFKELDQLDLLKFYQYIDHIKSNFPVYISKKDMIQFWRGEKQCQFLDKQEQQCYHKVFRVLSKIFLESFAIKWIVSSKKMKRELKKEHIKHCRIMKQMLIKSK